MPDIHLPKRLFCGELEESKCTQGGQEKKKRYKDTLKDSLKSFGIDPDSWEILAQDRAAWRSCISKGAASYEQSRVAEVQKKRELRNPTGHLCVMCGRVSRAHNGLISHSWTHRTQSTSLT
ncbi:hypothetical protein NDU88_003431 [Pleurodeles waltl]|uniref:C2H2-type domain-containing protein n=1 Tax=Pleurodeles waltl TaxID=8319 RepID=A0AAV7W502_PLEWA|nr:hypothetical protein NDU88_003431 [Pleurodeles waltl]